MKRNHKSFNSNKKVNLFTKQQREYFILFGLKKPIKLPTCLAYNSSSILDYVLARGETNKNKLHQKTPRIKTNHHK